MQESKLEVTKFISLYLPFTRWWELPTISIHLKTPLFKLLCKMSNHTFLCLLLLYKKMTIKRRHFLPLLHKKRLILFLCHKYSENFVRTAFFCSEHIFLHEMGIPKIRCVTCLQHQPFDMKKEKNTVFVLIIAPIPIGDPSLLCLNFIK